MELNDRHRKLKFSEIDYRTAYNEALASNASAKFDSWYHALDTIVHRKITNELDVLPALSGLA
jgi:hypothetical protein